MVAIAITQAATILIDAMVAFQHGARQVGAEVATAVGVPGWERSVDVAEFGGRLSTSCGRPHSTAESPSPVRGGLHLPPKLSGSEPRIRRVAGCARKSRRGSGLRASVRMRARRARAFTNGASRSDAGRVGSPGATLFITTQPASPTTATRQAGLSLPPTPDRPRPPVRRRANSRSSPSPPGSDPVRHPPRSRGGHGARPRPTRG